MTNKKQRISHHADILQKVRNGGLSLAMVFLSVPALCGCSHSSYEKMTFAETIAQGNKQEDTLVLETEAKDPEEEILIETESAADMAGSDSREELADPDAEGDSMTILFSGDVLLSDHVLNAYSRAGGISGVLDQGYLSAIRSVDYFAVNEEFPFSSRGTKAADKQYTFRLAPEKVSILQEMGIDAVTLANNHALDYGTDALLDTCDVLDGAGILHTGAGKDLDAAKQPVVFEKNGQKVALIGATRVIPESNWAATNGHPGMLSSYEVSVEPLLSQIAECHAQGEKVVVLIHWGIERDETPQEYQRALAKCYIDAGADLVIGSHPHVLQGIEYYKGKPIFYSLGNFVFGSSIPKTMLVQAEFENDSLNLKLIPGTSSGGYTHTLTGEGEKTQFYQYLEGISFGTSIGSDGTVSQQP